MPEVHGYDFRAFVRENKAPKGQAEKRLDWNTVHMDGAGRCEAYLTLSRTSALEPEGEEGPCLGLHLVVSYDAVMSADVHFEDRARLISCAYKLFYGWRNRHPEIPGEVAFAGQEPGWGTQPHLHMHFYLAPTVELATFGYAPQRYVDSASRIKPLKKD